MKNTLKKSLSLVLAILMIFSMASFAFALYAEEDARVVAMEYIAYKTYNQLVSEEKYSDDEVSNKVVYKVTSMVILEDGTAMKYEAYIDKNDGTVYNKNADYIIPIATALTPLTEEEAYNYVLKALCANEEDVVMFKKSTIEENGKAVAYSYEFVENFYVKHKCTIDAKTGFIDNISIVEPVNIIDRVILMIKVLFTKLLGVSIF